jgi:hypothetical protein
MRLQTRYHLLPVAHIVFLTVLMALGQGASAAEKARVVGTAAKGVSAVTYIGEIHQAGPEFLAIGYLTHVRGLDPSDLFTDPNTPDASTARFTFSGNASLVSRAQVGTVTQLGAVGTLAIYFNEAGGADFNDHDSFSSGLEIATSDARFHNVLAVIAPNEGVSSATADTVQQTAHGFMLNGKRLKFGHGGLIQRLTLSGRATRSQADPPMSITEFAASGGNP